MKLERKGRDKIVGKIKSLDIEKFVSSEQSVYATQIWNAGIEACIIKIQEYKVGPYYFLKTELKRLKK